MLPAGKCILSSFRQRLPRLRHVFKHGLVFGVCCRSGHQSAFLSVLEILGYFFHAVIYEAGSSAGEHKPRNTPGSYWFQAREKKEGRASIRSLPLQVARAPSSGGLGGRRTGVLPLPIPVQRIRSMDKKRPDGDRLRRYSEDHPHIYRKIFLSQSGCPYAPPSNGPITRAVQSTRAARR